MKILVVVKDISILGECGWGGEVKRMGRGDKVPMWVGE